MHINLTSSRGHHWCQTDVPKMIEPDYIK